MAALHNASGASLNFRGSRSGSCSGLSPGSTVFGHPGEAWAMRSAPAPSSSTSSRPRHPRVRPILPWRTVLRVHGSVRSGRSHARRRTSYAVDGVFGNGSQIELTNISTGRSLPALLEPRGGRRSLVVRLTLEYSDTLGDAVWNRWRRSQRRWCRVRLVSTV
jgi:hypothetical protein